MILENNKNNHGNNENSNNENSNNKDNNQDNQNKIIEIKNLGIMLNDVWIHKNLNLTITANKIVTIIGNSGCGKTTLMRAMLMLQAIHEGEIYIASKKLADYSIDDPYSKYFLSQMGVMFQHGALFSSLTVLENVMFIMREYTKFSDAMIYDLAIMKLQLTGLDSSAYKKYPSELSGGMLKRAALARALALDPKILFLDEPTAGLDPNSASVLDELILSLREQLQLTVVMITHDLDSIWRISDELVYMGHKKVLFHDTVAYASQNTNIPELYQYFNGLRGVIVKDHYTA